MIPADGHPGLITRAIGGLLIQHATRTFLLRAVLRSLLLAGCVVLLSHPSHPSYAANAAPAADDQRVLIGISGSSDLDIGFSAAISRHHQQGPSSHRIEMTTRQDALFTLVELDTMLKERLKTACLLAALAEVRRISAEQVGLLGQDGDEFRFRLLTMILPVTAAPDVALVTSEDIVAELEDGERRQTPRTLAGCLGHLGNHAAALAANGHDVILAIPHPQALSWAAAHEQGPESLRGYALGILLGEAVALAAPDLTRSSLTAALQGMPLSANTVYLEPHFTPASLIRAPLR